MELINDRITSGRVWPYLCIVAIYFVTMGSIHLVKTKAATVSSGRFLQEMEQGRATFSQEFQEHIIVSDAQLVEVEMRQEHINSCNDPIDCSITESLTVDAVGIQEQQMEIMAALEKL